MNATVDRFKAAKDALNYLRKYYLPTGDLEYQWVDEQLGRWLDAFPTPPNVVIVSDDGQVATENHIA